MSIIKNRSPRYATVPSETIRDPDLNGDLLGLLVFMLDFPEDWKVSIAWIVRQKRFGHNTKVVAAMKRLRELGYARLQRNADGTTIWEISSVRGTFVEPSAHPEDDPDSDFENMGLPHSKKPNSQKPNSQKPNSGFGNGYTNSNAAKGEDTNGLDTKRAGAHVAGSEPVPDLFETESEPTPIEKAKKPETPKPRNPILSTPDDMPEVSPEIAAAFLAVRKSKNAPLTRIAWADIVREAGRAGVSVDAAVTECLNRGWRGFKSDWIKPAAHSKQQPKKPLDDVIEEARRILFGDAVEPAAGAAAGQVYEGEYNDEN